MIFRAAVIAPFIVVASHAIAQSNIDEAFVCLSDKQLANAMVRGCPTAQNTAISAMIAEWTAQGKLEEVKDNLAKAGVKLKDLTVQPYRCILPAEYLALGNDEKEELGDHVRQRIARLAEIHGMPPNPQDWPLLSTTQVCEAIETAFEKNTDLKAHLQEYGLD